MKPTTTAPKPVSLVLIFILFFIIPIGASWLPATRDVQKWIAVVLLLALTIYFLKKEGRGLSALGLRYRSFPHFFVGMLLGLICFCVLVIVQIWYNHYSLTSLANVDYGLVLLGLWALLPGVLMEELIFRGYCFVGTTRRIGFPKANLIFAFMFIVWHWIALNAWGNAGFMLSLITTGFGHLFFAVGLKRSGTLFFPIGVHLGNNWASRNGFGYQLSGGPVGEHDTIFAMTGDASSFSTLHTIISYLITISIFLLFTWLTTVWYEGKPGLGLK